MTNDAAVAWLVTNGGKSCEPWLVWELSEVKALPSSCIADPLYSATTVAELRAKIRELTADRDSWLDQASERVRNWHEEHEARKAAERRVADLEVAAFAARGRIRYLNSLTGEKIDADVIDKINAALTKESP